MMNRKNIVALLALACIQDSVNADFRGSKIGANPNPNNTIKLSPKVGAKAERARQRQLMTITFPMKTNRPTMRPMKTSRPTFPNDGGKASGKAAPPNMMNNMMMNDMMNNMMMNDMMNNMMMNDMMNNMMMSMNMMGMMMNTPAPSAVPSAVPSQFPTPEGSDETSQEDSQEDSNEDTEQTTG
ncbi:unnamed protein product [Pseudo-nitzschia multistriata]|uniref:RxLR effector protein n=1 Tax=Pseudo-nitzschia multistriata TaxID=183589 RepID=A0A448ZG25_9STRA|nr:unnamed protein product [Pseudo-nitzschia multistriata]